MTIETDASSASRRSVPLGLILLGILAAQTVVIWTVVGLVPRLLD